MGRGGNGIVAVDRRRVCCYRLGLAAVGRRQAAELDRQGIFTISFGLRFLLFQNLL